MSVAAYSRFTERGIARRAAERRAALLPPPSAPEPEIASDEPSKPVIAVCGKRYVFTDETVIQFPPAWAEVKRVVGLVARMHGVTYDQVVNSKRKFFDARMACICAAAQLRPDLTLQQLGNLFDRDHTSIVNAMKRRGFTR